MLLLCMSLSLSECRLQVSSNNDFPTNSIVNTYFLNVCKPCKKQSMIVHLPLMVLQTEVLVLLQKSCPRLLPPTAVQCVAWAGVLEYNQQIMFMHMTVKESTCTGRTDNIWICPCVIVLFLLLNGLRNIYFNMVWCCVCVCVCITILSICEWKHGSPVSISSCHCWGITQAGKWEAGWQW